MPVVHIEGTEIFFHEQGRGPSAMFLHGFALDHSMWLDQIEGLARLRRCVTPDLRGFGRTPLVGIKRLDFARQADDLAALSAALGTGPMDVVGHSYGGHAALSLTHRHPTLVRSLVLIGVALLRDLDVPKERDPAILLRGREAYAADILPNLVSKSASLIARARVRTMLERVPYETLFVPTARESDEEAEPAMLAGLALPFLALVGQDDRVATPAMVRDLAAQARGGHVVEIGHAGHMAPVEQPAAVIRAISDYWSALG